VTRATRGNPQSIATRGWSRAGNGSSRSRTAGSRTSARPSAVRWASPPERLRAGGLGGARGRVSMLREA
jgi:hypothetical protein